MRFLAEALAQSARRKRKQVADGVDAELEKRVAELGLDVQTVEENFLRGGALPGGIAKDRDVLRRPGNGIAAEAREAGRQIYDKPLRAKIPVNGFGPLLRRSVESLQAGAVEPKNAGLVRRRLDFGGKRHQTMRQFTHDFFYFRRRHCAGAQRGG